MDNLSKDARHRTMVSIRSKNTLPELLVFKELRKRKLYFVRHVVSLIGKPDIVFRRKKVVVFIDSDFWHSNPKKFIAPKTNIEYWNKKIERNKERDRIVNKELKKMGWKVVRIWESAIKKDIVKVVDRIERLTSKREVNKEYRPRHPWLGRYRE